MKKTALSVILLLISSLSFGQPTFTRSDSLRGYLYPERTAYDVVYYGLDVRIDPSDSSLTGSNTIFFRAMAEVSVIQLELFENMSIDRVSLEGAVAPLPVEREGNSFFVTFPEQLMQGSLYTMTIEYHGRPQVAQRPPWDGGFTYSSDAEGNPWVCVTCQGTGASLWWPNKDHQEDEPDSMMIAVTVPPGLQNVSNGRLRSTTLLDDDWTRFEWFISYPINNYNVTFNIGSFAHFTDVYEGEQSLTLDYYVMPENLDKAKKQFDEVKTMFDCLEPFFGPFPFPRDGFKLIESPHNGMEHQTAIAYGNRYLGGYVGRASSAVGLNFDFIIIHETAHEWWGNNVTSKDIADMWIHESFGAYTEALYVECRWGYEQSLAYMNGKKSSVLNDRPIIGIPGVHYRGSGDMYNKGQLVLNTVRSVFNDDARWTGMLRGIQESFGLTTVDADDIFGYMNTMAQKDLTPIYKQYFASTRIPNLDLVVIRKGSSTSLRYRWTNVADEFEMPFELRHGADEPLRFEAGTSWSTSDIGDVSPEALEVDDMRFYITARVRHSYLDPRLTP
jgi:aminopeptidase N